jgi:cytochrome bd-type quinol oxidase subunit 1
MRAVSVHCEHGWVADGGTWPATMADLWTDADRLLGFMGMYTALGILFLFLVRREIENGPLELEPALEAHSTTEAR